MCSEKNAKYRCCIWFINVHKMKLFSRSCKWRRCYFSIPVLTVCCSYISALHQCPWGCVVVGVVQGSSSGSLGSPTLQYMTPNSLTVTPVTNDVSESLFILSLLPSLSPSLHPPSLSLSFSLSLYLRTSVLLPCPSSKGMQTTWTRTAHTRYSNFLVI